MFFLTRKKTQNLVAFFSANILGQKTKLLIWFSYDTQVEHIIW